MKAVRIWLFVVPAVLGLLIPALFVSGQLPLDNDTKPAFTAEQKKALSAFYEHGGILIHLDEQRPGQPVVMVDFASHPEFSDDWLKHLLLFPELTVVRLAGTAITDAGLDQLAKIPKLTELVLDDTPITDAGLTKLAACKQLRALNLRRTRVSPTAIALLSEALPELLVKASPPKVELSSEQAVAELKKLGGILVHYDDRKPGNPVIMVDVTNQLGFQDEWTRYFPALPQLRQIGLSGTPVTDAGLDVFADIAELDSLFLAETKITDAGLAKLAGCNKLTYLDVQGTRVTPAGVAALRKSLPRLELVVEPEKLVAVDLPIRPPTELNADKESVQALGGIDPPTAGAGVVKRFTAQAITQWREQLTELGYLPEGTPDGWSKCRVDPAKMLTVFPELRVRQGYVLRAYVFKEDANANGFVCALPADADFPEPDDCPRLESHFLTPPKPLDALDDIMEVIEGDDSPESYLHASILRRELREFGGGWHGIQWGMNTVLDASPWESVPTVGDEPATDRPTSKPHDWKWRSPQPETWSPEVRMDQNQVVVTFYSYTPLSRDLGNGEVEKERIIHHTDTYRRGKYRPLVVEKKLAEGPNAVVF